jgi:hypothetical protein
MTDSVYDFRCGCWPRYPDVRTVKLPRTLQLEEARRTGEERLICPAKLARFLIELLRFRVPVHDLIPAE